MKKIIAATLFFIITNLSAQISYTGFLDKYPIELVTYMYSDGVGKAIYTYSNFDTPIILEGILKKNTLTLLEKDKNEKKTAKMTFQNYDAQNKELIGVWTDLTSGKELKIKLTKTFDVEDEKSSEWRNKEILQPYSLKDKYFKLLISKTKESGTGVTGVKIIEKKTDKLIQKIDLNVQLWSLDNIGVGDFNFDGIQDFSVFESSYAGPNTSKLYFLYNPKTGKYFESSYSGTSLEFDSKTKRIHEHNQCCAGSKHINAEYKVVNNKMVLVKQTCLELDLKTGDFKKVKCD